MSHEPGADEVQRLAQLLEAGALDDARALGEQLAQRYPQSAAVWHLLGGAHSLSGDDAAAGAAFARAVELAPEAIESRLYLAIALSRAGDPQQALAEIADLLRREPEYVPGYLARARAQERLNDYDGAAQTYRAALLRESDNPAALIGLGGALHLLGRDAEARDLFRRLLHAGPAYEAQIGLGMCALPEGVDEAQLHFRAALELNPQGAEALDGLAFIARERGRPSEALLYAQRATECSGRAPQYLAAQASLLRERAQNDEALKLLNECCALAPGENAYFSARLLTLQYMPGLRREELFRAHREWAEQVLREPPHPPLHTTAVAGSCPVTLGGAQMSLRIGFLSPDLRAHPVAFFLMGILAELRRQGTEVFLYSCSGAEDGVTRKLRDSAPGQWRTVCGLSDDTAAALIRRDNLDWLIDLAGHTPGNRLGVMVRRPARFHATWLGYPDTTGLRAIDYRIVDCVTDPAGAEAWVSEKLLRLPGCFLCYTPADDAPPVAPPPCKRDGHITFGCFNNPAKLSDPCLRLWARILRNVPNSRLLLKGGGFEEIETRAHWLRRLNALGIEPDRVELTGRKMAMVEHLRQYDRVDIALDPFPYNGTTTTCDALWQGVPVLTRCGDSHAGHVGASLLEVCGLADWVSSSDEGVLALARWHATGPDCAARLMQLRAELRRMMRPLTDAVQWTRTFLAALHSVM